MSILYAFIISLMTLIVSQFILSDGQLAFNFNSVMAQLKNSTNNNINNSSSNNNSFDTGIKTLDYYARYNCGTISNDSGPLRPGKYDSDITIFNKKDFPLTVIWKAIEINQEKKENFNILNIPAQNIVNINCSKIHMQNNLQNSFREGIVQIRITINNGQLVNNIFSNQEESIFINDNEINNLINVDVLNTVNTLNDLNKENFYLKTKFNLEIPNESNTKKISSNYTGIFKINPEQLINSTDFIKNILLNNHILNKTKLNETKISLLNSDIVSNTLTDNHALTIQKVEPIVS